MRQGKKGKMENVEENEEKWKRERGKWWKNGTKMNNLTIEGGKWEI